VCNEGENNCTLIKPFSYFTHFPLIDPDGAGPIEVCTPTSGVGCFDNSLSSEVFYSYNSYIYGTISSVANGADASEKILNIDCVACEVPRLGTFLRSLGTDLLPVRTRVTQVVASSSSTLQLRVAAFNASGVRLTSTFSAPTGLAGETVCGGVCALLGARTGATAESVQYSVERTGYPTNTSYEWAGGFVCARVGNVDSATEFQAVLGRAVLGLGGWEESVSD
jgi:hypothetical protein